MNSAAELDVIRHNIGAKTRNLEITGFPGQSRNVLRNCDLINPENIEEYIARDGYFALAKVLKEMTPLQIIAEIKKSGLRGRGGGGFPTGRKWEFTHQAKAEKKYVICNADEGDPGAFMDRSILEEDPHAVLEAMCIAGYAIGSDQGYIYVRAEYPLAVKRLEIALRQAREKGLLGRKLLGTDFIFNIEIRWSRVLLSVGGNFLIRQSKFAREPRPRPAFSAVQGLGKALLINNVETYATFLINSHGSDWFDQRYRTRKGTKVFAWQ